MTVDFVRFQATDSVELQGWLSDVDGDMAALHIHGMSGNGYANYFLDNLRKMYTAQGISFFAINTRGHGIVSTFWQGGDSIKRGSCFELLEESVSDIQGALDYLKTKGKTKFILQGHSLGCTKVLNYLLTQHTEGIEKVILLAPTDMSGWAATDPNHQDYLAKAKQLLSQGKPEELVGAECWQDKTPLSAQTYPSICEAGSAADIYGGREGGALFGRVDISTLIAYGTIDIGITNIDGSADKWLERTNKIKNANTTISLIDGASHSYKDYEPQLAEIIQEFIGV